MIENTMTSSGYRSVPLGAWLALAQLAWGGCDAGGSQRGGWLAEEPAPDAPHEVAPPPPDAPHEVAPPPPAGPTPLIAMTLTREDALPTALMADAGHLYWTTAGGALYRVSKRGGAAELLADERRTPVFLTVGGEHAYWAVEDETGAGALLRVPKRGGAFETLANGFIGALAVHDARLFWVEEEERATTVVSAGTDGASPSAIMTVPRSEGEELAFAFAPDAVYWLGQGGPDQGGVALYRAPKSGGEVELVAASPRAGILPGSLRADGTQVAWLDWQRAMTRIALADRVVADVDGQQSFRAFALEEAGVIAVRLYAPGIVRYAGAGQGAQLLYETASDVALLSVDGAELAWAEWSTECTEERFEGKSAWCAAYRFDVQLVRAAR